MSRYQVHRIDGNARLIVETLQAHGLTWEPLGRPVDGAAGYAGRTYLLEIKQRHGKLRDSQAKFLARWTGHCEVIRSVDEATAFVARVKGSR